MRSGFCWRSSKTAAGPTTTGSSQSLRPATDGTSAASIYSREVPMGKWKTVVLIIANVLVGGMVPVSAPQAPAVRSLDERALREYAGVYRWQKDAFLYLQLWSEFSGKNQLVAFDESGEV